MDKLPSSSPDFKALNTALDKTNSIFTFGKKVTENRKAADEQIIKIRKEISDNPEFKIDKSNIKIVKETLNTMRKLKTYYKGNEEFTEVRKLIKSRIGNYELDSRSGSSSQSSRSASQSSRSASLGSLTESFEVINPSSIKEELTDSSDGWVEVETEKEALKNASQFVDRLVPDHLDLENGVVFVNYLDPTIFYDRTEGQVNFLQIFQSVIAKINDENINSAYPTNEQLLKLSKSFEMDSFVESINGLSGKELDQLINSMSLSQVALLKDLILRKGVSPPNATGVTSNLYSTVNTKHNNMAEAELKNLLSKGVVDLANGINDRFPLAADMGKNPVFYKQAIEGVYGVLSSPPKGMFKPAIQGKLTLKGIVDLQNAFTLAYRNSATTPEQRGQIHNGLIALRHLFEVETRAFNPNKKIDLKFADPTQSPYLEFHKATENNRVVSRSPQGSEIQATDSLLRDINRCTLIDSTGKSPRLLFPSLSIDRPEDVPERLKAVIDQTYNTLFNEIKRVKPDLSDAEIHELAQKGLENMAQQSLSDVIPTMIISMRVQTNGIDSIVNVKRGGVNFETSPDFGEIIPGSAQSPYYSLIQQDGEVFMQYTASFQFVRTDGQQFFQTARVTIPVSDPNRQWGFELFPDDSVHTKLSASIGLKKS